MRHLETVNKFLHFAEHHFVLVPRKFSSHHTQMPHTAGRILPAGTCRVGYNRPLSCDCSSYIYTFPTRLPMCLHGSTWSTDQCSGERPACCTQCCHLPRSRAGRGSLCQCLWGNFWQYQTLSGSCWSPPRQRFLPFLKYFLSNSLLLSC